MYHCMLILCGLWDLNPPKQWLWHTAEGKVHIYLSDPFHFYHYFQLFSSFIKDILWQIYPTEQTEHHAILFVSKILWWYSLLICLHMCSSFRLLPTNFTWIPAPCIAISGVLKYINFQITILFCNSIYQKIHFMFMP